MAEGAFGPPAEGAAIDGLVGEGSGAPAEAVPPGRSAAGSEESPDWLAAPEVVVPRTAEAARDAVEGVFAAAAASTGNVAVFARWSGSRDARRSPA